MQQIKNNKLCTYCLGCNKLENEQFEGVMNCKGFVAGKNIKEFYKRMKESDKNGV